MGEHRNNQKWILLVDKTWIKWVYIWGSQLGRKKDRLASKYLKFSEKSCCKAHIFSVIVSLFYSYTPFISSSTREHSAVLRKIVIQRILLHCLELKTFLSLTFPPSWLLVSMTSSFPSWWQGWMGQVGFSSSETGCLTLMFPKCYLELSSSVPHPLWHLAQGLKTFS